MLDVYDELELVVYLLNSKVRLSRFFHKLYNRISLDSSCLNNDFSQIKFEKSIFCSKIDCEWLREFANLLKVRV